MRHVPSVLWLGLLSSVTAVSETNAGAQEAPSVEERLAAQEARIKELEQKLSAQPKPATPPPLAAPAPKPAEVPLFGFSATEGVWIGRPDVAQVRLRALVQADARLYFDTAATP